MSIARAAHGFYVAVAFALAVFRPEQGWLEVTAVLFFIGASWDVASAIKKEYSR